MTTEMRDFEITVHKAVKGMVKGPYCHRVLYRGNAPPVTSTPPAISHHKLAALLACSATLVIRLWPVLAAVPRMADACWVDFGCSSELELGPRSLGLSETESTLNGSIEMKRSATADADQKQVSITANASPSSMSKTTEVEDPAGTVEAPPPSVEDYCCPICLELLLRPVKLSCGHRLCRGCWAHVLQRRTVLFISNGITHFSNPTCPLGRCSVGPIVPTLDVVLMSELELWFGPQLLARAADHPLADEERTVSVVNARVAADHKPDASEVTAVPGERAREERGGDAGGSGSVARVLSIHGLRAWLRGIVARVQSDRSWIRCIVAFLGLIAGLFLIGFGCRWLQLIRTDV